MNIKATLSPNDLRRACADAMRQEDDASKGLGMGILRWAGPGDLTMGPSRTWSTGGASRMAALSSCSRIRLRLCLQFLQRACRRGAVRDHLHWPGKLGDRLVATAREI